MDVFFNKNHLINIDKLLCGLRKVKNYFANNKIWTKRKAKNILRLRKISRNVFFFVIYYSIAIYPPLVGQIKFGNYWTAGMWLDKTFLDFSWSRSCCWQGNFWLFLNHILLNLDLLLSTFIKLFLLEKIGERFWRWRKLCPMRNLIYI